MKLKLILTMMFLCSGCAVLHHIQISDIDNRATSQAKARKVEFKASEMGIDLNDARFIARRGIGGNAGAKADEALKILGLFQMGPRTGAPVYDLSYIKDISSSLYGQCQDGTLTGINSIRETRKYPVISGEIVKFTAYCIKN